MTNDIDLTFDPEMFKKGFTEILGVMGRIESKLTDVTKSTTQMETSGAKSIGLWTALMTTGLNFLISLAHKIMGFIPEIGYSFKIAGEIIGRNLLWPLRQQLIPILQGMLNWIRDHRAMFVRWGVMIANVFRVVKTVVVSFYQMMMRIWEQVAGGIQKIFGGTAKTVSEIINVLLFKFAVVMMAIQMAVEPILTFFVGIFLQLVKLSKAFYGGLWEGLTGVLDPIEDIIESFKRLLDMGEGLEGFANKLTAAFGLLGRTLGGTIKLTLISIAQSLDNIVSALQLIPALIWLIKEIQDPTKSWKTKDLASRFDAIADIATGWAKRTGTRYGSGAEVVSERVVDVVQTIKGRGEGEAGRPKGGLGGGGRKLSFGDININVEMESPTGTDPKFFAHEMSRVLAIEMLKEIDAMNLNDGLKA